MAGYGTDAVNRHEDVLSTVYKPLAKIAERNVAANEQQLNDVLNVMLQQAQAQVIANHGSLINVQNSIKGAMDERSTRAPQTDESTFTISGQHANDTTDTLTEVASNVSPNIGSGSTSIGTQDGQDVSQTTTTSEKDTPSEVIVPKPSLPIGIQLPPPTPLPGGEVPPNEGGGTIFVPALGTTITIQSTCGLGPFRRVQLPDGTKLCMNGVGTLYAPLLRYSDSPTTYGTELLRSTPVTAYGWSRQ